MSTISYDAWEAKGRELFGADMRAWRFHCPTCGLDMSIADAIEKHPDVKGKGWSPEQECIGRYTKAAGCDWCAYGLFRGPLFVERGTEKVPCFDFAGQPFTKKATP